MKRIVVIFLIIFLFTGCEIKDISKNDVDNFIDNSFKAKKLPINKSFKGYKFAVPRGFLITDKKENNYILLSNKDYYYLYIDIVSYFYKREIKPQNGDNLYFYQDIDYKDKKGYIRIEEINDEYFIKILYNYSKIEVYTEKKNLEHAIENSIGILLSIEYNDIILNSMIGENILDYKEENFKLFESKREDGTFLDYIEEYENYDEKHTIKDDDFIE